MVLSPGASKASSIAWEAAPNLTGEQHGFAGDFFDFLARMSGDAQAPWRGHRFPWPGYGALVPDDLAALHTYLAGVPRRSGDADRVVRASARWCEFDEACGPGASCDQASHSCEGQPCDADAACAICQACTGATCQAPADVGLCTE